MVANLDAEAARVAALRDRLEQGILARVPSVAVNGGGAPRVPNTTNLCFEGIEGEAMVIALDKHFEATITALRGQFPRQPSWPCVQTALSLPWSAVVTTQRANSTVQSMRNASPDQHSSYLSISRRCAVD